MKRLTVILSTCLALLFGSSVISAYYHQGQSQTKDRPVPTRLIIKLKGDIKAKISHDKAGKAATGVPAFDAVNAKHGIKKQDFLFPGASEKNHPDKLKNILIVDLPSGTDPWSVIEDYRRLKEVVYVEPDYPMELMGRDNPRPPPDPIDTLPPIVPPTMPNDSLYTLQWGMHNFGQGYYDVDRIDGDYNDTLMAVFGTIDADIDFNEVFLNPPDNTTTVIVAIIDTGVDCDHPDLAGNVWTNADEIAGNGIDDDNNGFVDDVRGWDFVGNDDFQPILEDNNPADYFGHGTHCAGIVAALTNNSRGVAGIAPKARIMPVKIFPLAFSSIAALGIIYATDNGADIISMSWGTPWPSTLLEDALAYAHERGVVLVASAGNSGGEDCTQPACLPNVIEVGATNSDDHVTFFSTYNDHLSVCAPGQAILSLRAAETDMYADDGEPGVHIIENDYYLADGTSMSGPFVAGVAAYIRSVAPELTPEKTQDIIESSADDFVDPYGLGANLPGWDMYSGHGRANLEKAMIITPSRRAVITAPDNFDVISNSFAVTGTANGWGFTNYSLEYRSLKNPTFWTIINQSNTPVTNGLLGTWNLANLHGQYELVLHVDNDNFVSRRVFVANSPQADILTPENDETIAGSASITGSAFCPNFKYAVIEHRLDGASDWSPVDTLTVPVDSGSLAYWNPGGSAPGAYKLRLSVYSTSGLAAQDEIDVTVEWIFSGEHGWSAPLAAKPGGNVNYGDFDGNDSNELIIGTEAGIQIFNIDGTPNTTVPISMAPPGNYTISIAVGNLDGDGVDDFVAVRTAGGTTGKLFGYCSNASDFLINLVDTAQINLFFNYQDGVTPSVYLRDIDNDGLDEIHYFVGDQLQYAEYNYRIFNHDGTLWSNSLPVPDRDMARYCLPADLNGDNTCEIYCFVNEWYAELRQYSITGGYAIQSVSLEHDGCDFWMDGMSAGDIDQDGKEELLISGKFEEAWPTLHLYAFDEGMQLMAGWPHDTHISGVNAILHPVFGDLDDNGELEYLTSVYDIDLGYIHAWHLDGTPFLPTGGSNGLFKASPVPQFYSHPILVDADGDGVNDVLTATGPHILGQYDEEWISGFNINAEGLAQYPLFVAPDAYEAYSFGPRNPTVGDIDKDGNLDLVYASESNQLVFRNFPDVPYDPDHAPVPMWRYNRKLNNSYIPGAQGGIGNGLYAVGKGTPDKSAIPSSFELRQNNPNPFNPTTTIEFSLPTASQVTLEIFNVVGQTVATPVNDYLEAGQHSAVWDGADSHGDRVATGIYLYRISAGNFSETRRMILLK